MFLSFFLLIFKIACGILIQIYQEFNFPFLYYFSVENSCDQALIFNFTNYHIYMSMLYQAETEST